MSKKEKKVRKSEDSDKGFRIVRKIVNPLYKFWYNPKVIGAENIPEEGAIIVAGNHMHIMDQCNVFLATKRTMHYMAKKEYFDGKFAWFFRFAGCIPVDRDRNDMNCLRSALSVLSRGGAIGIFPEGTRNKTEKFLLRFKPGTGFLAKRSGAKIVPFGVAGDYKFRSKNLRIVIGKPIDPTDMSRDEITEKLREEIGRLMIEAAENNHPKAHNLGA